MATTRFNIQSPIYIEIKPACCPEVYLCLTDAWKAKMIDGTGLALATIENNGRQLANDPMRCSPVYQYTVEVDLTQFIVDRDLGVWTPTCEDVVEILPDVCLIDKLLTRMAISEDADNAIIRGSDGGLFACDSFSGISSSGVLLQAPVDISGIGTITVLSSAVMSFNNTSTCRPMSVMTVGDNTLQATLLATGNWTVQTEVSVDGGAWTLESSATYEAPTGDITMPLILPTFTVTTVPINDSVTLQRRIKIITNTGTGASSLITGGSIGIRVLSVSN